MRKLFLCSILFLLLFSSAVVGYNKIWEFDDNDDVVITTSVYNTTGKPCEGCTCNLSIYFPHPNESIINISILLRNKGGGVYSTNVSNTTMLSFNKEIYPLTIICNDSSGFFGGDTREGIKIGETLFDYTAPILAIIVVGVALLFASFKIDPRFWKLQMLTFFGSLPFFIGSVFIALEIVKHSPNNANFIMIFDIMFWAILAITLALYYLRFVDLMTHRLQTKQVK